MKKFLIVKTSAIGDIIQSFPCVDYLKEKYPDCEVHWVANHSFQDLLSIHSKIDRVISFKKNSKFFFPSVSFIKQLQKQTYDALFDLQGNCKSALITFFAKARKKVGFNFRSVKEWPNCFATNLRYHVNQRINIREQYLSILSQFFQDPANSKHLFTQSPFVFSSSIRCLVCLGSKWKNKQLQTDELLIFLKELEEKYAIEFLFCWGDNHEKSLCQIFASQLNHAQLLPKLSLSQLKRTIEGLDLVVAYDSSLLHLAGLANTPTFSVYGPTSKKVFKPIGPQHFGVQGSCPYHLQFKKQCPFLRSCPTGSCIKSLSGKYLFQEFEGWWENKKIKNENKITVKK